MEKEKKIFQKEYLFPVLVGLVIVFILSRFTFPQVEQILEARRELKREKGQLEQLIKKATDLERLDEETLKNNFEITQKALPSEKDISGLLFTINRLRNEATISSGKFQIRPGVISTPSATPSLATSSPATPSAGKTKTGPQAVQKERSQTLASLNFKLSLSGGFVALRNFLEKIKGISPLLVVSSLDFSQKEEEIKADLGVVFHYQFLPSFLGKIDDALPVLTEKDKEILAQISNFPDYSQIPSIVNLIPLGKLNPFE